MLTNRFVNEDVDIPPRLTFLPDEAPV